MARSRSELDQILRPKASTDSSRWYWFAAAAVAVLSAALMAYRLGEAIQGFHSFNEGFYLANGFADASRGFFAPVVAPLDPNNPFVYPMVLATVLRLFGLTTAAGRAVSVVASAATVLFTFALAKALYNDRIAIIAAILFAFIPGEMLVGRNVQIDPLMMTFMVAASWAFVKAAASESGGWSIAAGVLLGVGMLTKLPAALLIPAFAIWQVWRTHGLAWIKDRSTWMTAAAFGVTVLPWYAYRYFASSEFRSSQSYLAGIAKWQGLSFLTHIAWMFSPLLVAAVAGGIVFMAVKRQVADKFVLSVLGTLMAVFAFYHFHVYYFLPLVPFGAIAAARGLYALAGKRWLPSVALTAVMVLCLLGFSLVALSAKKYTGVPTDQYVPLLAEKGFDPTKLTLGMDQQIAGAYRPPIELYARQAGVAGVVEVPLGIAGIAPGTTLIALANTTPTPPAGFTPIANPEAKLVAPILFGTAVIEMPGKASFFDLIKPQLRRVGPWWRFGFMNEPAVAPQYTLYLYQATS